MSEQNVDESTTMISSFKHVSFQIGAYYTYFSLLSSREANKIETNLIILMLLKLSINSFHFFVNTRQ